MKKFLLNPWLSLITLTILLTIRFIDFSFVESIRLRYFDQLITSQPQTTIPVNVVNIDEAALDKYGQFPFPRKIYAEIIEELYARNAGIVVFNVMMPEPDRFNGDSVLAKTMIQNPVILPSLGSVKGKNNPRNPGVSVIGNDPNGRVVEFPGMIANTAKLESSAIGVGIVNTFPEVDGVVRRTPLVILSNNILYPSLALETLRVDAGDTSFQIKIGEVGVEALRIPKFGKITTDSLSRVWIDWSQTPKQFSLSDLPKDFNDEIVIVGLSAAGLVNPVATSKGEIWPQDLQAATLGTMLSGTTIQRPIWADDAELLIILISCIVMIFLSRWTYGFIPVILFIVSSHWIATYVFHNYHYLVDVTFFVIGTVLVYVHAYTVKFLSEYFQKQEIRKQFSTYLSPDMVAKLIKDPTLLHLGGTEKELTIQFTDVRGFTSISEHYGKDVQGLTKIMNRYMTAMTKKILENDGTLDKFIGDATMAFWNAPIDETQHCKDAVKASLEMIDSLKEFNAEIAKEGTPPFGMGVGLNTGVVVVGNMGSEQRFDYTCLGDAVNLASRLEGQSKNYGVGIVLGPITAERLGDHYFTLELDTIAVKGKKEGVTIFTVFRNPDNPIILQEWKQAKEHHNLMLEYYRKQQWEKARQMTKDLMKEFDGKMYHSYELWLERIDLMEARTLPSDWDGTYVALSK